MEIGIGLPCNQRNTDVKDFLAWARLAEEAGFSSLGVPDRLLYGNYGALTALTAAAVVTDRIRLTTAVLISPLWNTAVLAKESATLDRLSGGRLVLGLGLGGRTDDYEANDTPYSDRGATADRQVRHLKEMWAKAQTDDLDAVGPAAARLGGPEILIGGRSAAATRRAARLADGRLTGPGGPDAFRAHAAELAEAWEQAGRSGKPRHVAIYYFALGPDGAGLARAYNEDYYGFQSDVVNLMVARVVTEPAVIRSTIDAYHAAGCDELIFLPCGPDLTQVELLHAAIT